MPMRPVSIALIGAGFHARHVHIPALALCPELRLAAIATSRPETAREAAERHRVPSSADHRELLKRADVEAVLIATPTDLHEKICRDALDAGKHVFMESPGVPNADLSRELHAIAKKKNLVNQVGFLTRYATPFDLLKSHLDRTPAPRLFCYEYFPFLAHTYNLALYLSGPLDRVVSVSGSDAGSAVTLRFRNGDQAVVIGRSILNCSVDIERVTVSTRSYYGSVEGRRRVRIIENMKATDVADWGVASSGGMSYDPQPFAAQFLVSTGAVPQLKAFAAAIRGGPPPRSTLEDAADTQELLAQIQSKLNAPV